MAAGFLLPDEGGWRCWRGDKARALVGCLKAARRRAQADGKRNWADEAAGG